MKSRIFSVFDSAAAAFLPPIFLATPGLLERELRVLPEKSPNHNFVRYSEQFTVFELGEFDDATGRITQGTPEALFNLKVFFAQQSLPLSSVDDGPAPVERKANGAFRERVEGMDPDLIMERVQS